MITPEEVLLVQSSWEKVVPISDTAADLFYGKLFELDPSLKTMFPDEMAEQKKKLMQTLAVCVNGLNDLGEIVPAVKALGQRHVGYQVKDEHYATVGAALLWTLEQGLGGDYTQETANAWTAVYSVLATTMKDAAAQLTAA
jgi:hemoglobin-like flavoprotein